MGVNLVMKRFRLTGAILLAALVVTGCASGQTPAPAGSAVPVSAGSHAPVPAPSVSQEEPPMQTSEEYIEMLARNLVMEYTTAEMDDVEKIEAIYRYMVENIYFAEPSIPDLWRLRGKPDAPPSYLYSRALWPLECKIGSCEDFAAALTLVLRQAGFSAEYVSGLTVSAQREWVDHAWTVVRLGEDWYHLDCQLEQNVLKGGLLDYRYFLRDDEWMLADHLWGNWLASFWQGKQTPEQRQTLLDEMTPPLCQGPPLSRPAPVTAAMDQPDAAQVVKNLEQERKEYERIYGPLPPVSLNWEPPIFSVMPR